MSKRVFSISNYNTATYTDCVDWEHKWAKKFAFFPTYNGDHKIWLKVYYINRGRHRFAVDANGSVARMRIAENIADILKMA